MPPLTLTIDEVQWSQSTNNTVYIYSLLTSSKTDFIARCLQGHFKTLRLTDNQGEKAARVGFPPYL